MEYANVPTMDSLRDTSVYRCESGIPVFRPHVRYTLGIDRKPTSKVKYKVEEGDLEEICRNSNAAVREDYHFPRHTIGHVKFDNTPEHEQPAKHVGYSVNYRVGMLPNGSKVILADHYVRHEHWDEAKKYPYRSAEYNWKSKRIAGVARLLRDPALGLGTTTYESETTCYAEAVMEPKMGSVPDGMNAGDLNPDEAVMADRLWAYYVAKNPGLVATAAAPSGTNGELPEGDQKPEPEEGEEAAAAKKASEEGEGEEEEEEGDEEEGGKGRSQPPKAKASAKAKKKGKPKEDNDVSKNSDETVTPEAYAALQGETETLRKQLAEKTAEVEKAKVKAILDTLEVEKYEFDRAEVEVEMIGLDDAGRERKAANIRKHNKQKDAETVSVLEGNPTTQQLPGMGASSGMTAERYNRVMQHFLKNQSKGTTWAEALNEVK